jgi:hypothetical protein
MGKLRIKRIKKEGKIEGDSDNDTILPIFFQNIFLNKNFSINSTKGSGEYFQINRY